ncbi:MAG: tRNA dihydrouridine synthase DusB [Verrucomicrobia bacterium]|jgi:tRNA-dihydrouridine synthase B|nr:tRNA dihydrouridine synthase DusB [Verrucomicrobiota bacterium]
MLPWFDNNWRPLYLAPMAGVTDSVFRRLCKEQGADVCVTEFVSADGILHRNLRTREMLNFRAEERPVGVQLFGADPKHMADAAKAVIDWVAPDFIDLNFGCPVNKVVCKHGGAALLRDCPLLERVALAVVKAVEPLPVTAKIRLGWSQEMINATTTAMALEQAGISAVAVHGRTREQGYSGVADWQAIARVAETVSIPVVGNGDLRGVDEILLRLRSTRVRGLMIGRAAMTSPWLFRQARRFLDHGEMVPDPSIEERWSHILCHCRMAVAETGTEKHAMAAMRGRLMAYSKGMPGGRSLRAELQQVSSIAQVEAISRRHLAWFNSENVAEEGLVFEGPESFSNSISSAPGRVGEASHFASS